MIFIKDSYNWLVRFDRGELVMAGLVELVRQEGIDGAWVSGIGGALWAELGFYELDKQQYKWHKVDELLEVTALQGNIAWQDGQPQLHVHGNFAKASGQVVGGHVKELAAAGTVEVFLHRWYGDQLKRQHDDQVGLNTLSL